MQTFDDLLSRPKNIQHCQRPGFIYQIQVTLLLQLRISCLLHRRSQATAEVFYIPTQIYRSFTMLNGFSSRQKFIKIDSLKPMTLVCCIFFNLQFIQENVYNPAETQVITDQLPKNIQPSKEPHSHSLTLSISALSLLFYQI